jgi:hypothetical protein
LWQALKLFGLALVALGMWAEASNADTLALHQGATDPTVEGFSNGALSAQQARGQ